MNDSSTADSNAAAGPLLTSRKRQGTAARALAQRILTLERPQLLGSQPPAHLHPDHGGLVACGAGASAQLQALRPAFNGVLAEDAAAYEKQVATPDAPFDLPPDGMMFGNGLGDVLQHQIDRGASFTITPTRYVKARDSASLKAILKEVRTLERDDVLVILPVAIGWLQDETARKQLTAVINRIPHPVGLIFGCQYNPMDNFAAAVLNLRTLLREAPGTGLWRTDLAGFDALAHGGAFAAIGAGGAVRHLVPVGEPTESTDKGGGPVYPTVLLPKMLRFSGAKFLANTYANTPAPRCDCPQCGGTMLDSFLSSTDPVKAAANAHNIATWNTMLPILLAEQGTERQRWWRGQCKIALDTQAAENTRIGMPGRFKPDTHLKKWAGLAIDGETADRHGMPVKN